MRPSNFLFSLTLAFLLLGAALPTKAQAQADEVIVIVAEPVSRETCLAEANGSRIYTPDGDCVCSAGFEEDGQVVVVT